MKVNAIQTYHHSGTLIKFTERLDPASNRVIRDYYEDEDIKFTLITGGPRASRTVLYAKERLESFWRVGGIVDKAGTPILEEDEGYEINTIAPVLNAFGFIDGYAYGLTRRTGDLLSGTLVTS